MKDWTTKDFRKAAFAVGIGLTVGKGIGDLINAALSGWAIGLAKGLAKNGNKTAQEVCKKAEIDYEPKENDEKHYTKMKIGFHA